MNVFKILVSVVMIILVMSICVVFLQEYAPNSPQTSSFNNTLVNGSAVYKSGVYNPLNTTILASLSNANNMSGSSAQLGLAFAFIPENFGSMMTSIVQSPKILYMFMFQLLNGLSILSPITSASITGMLTGLITIFVLLLGLSAWLKYPLV